MPDQPPPQPDPIFKRELLGHVWVDSGQLVVTDPNYLEELDPETIDKATTLKERARLVMDGMAAAFRVGIRNGRYPIFVTRYANGAISKVEIVLDERGTDVATGETD